LGYVYSLFGALLVGHGKHSGGEGKEFVHRESEKKKKGNIAWVTKGPKKASMLQKWKTRGKRDKCSEGEEGANDYQGGEETPDGKRSTKTNFRKKFTGFLRGARVQWGGTC